MCLILPCICTAYKSLSVGLSVVLGIGANPGKDFIFMYILCGLFGSAAAAPGTAGSTISPGPQLQTKEGWPYRAGKCWMLAWKRLPSAELLVPALNSSAKFCSSQLSTVYVVPYSTRQGDYSPNSNLK